jgi:hypothetical protein
MEQGKKYRIVYKIQGVHRVARKGVAVFLGADKDQLGRTVYTFSGRPEFGTTEIRAEWVSEKVEVPGHIRCYMDRKL